MGEIVNVIERPSPRPGIVRFQTNRALSGMGHDRYVAGQVIDDNRPTDELARRIFARGGIASVHINGSVITVDLEKGFDGDGIADIVRGLFTYYVATPVEPTAEGGDATEAETEGHGEVVADVTDAPKEASASDAPDAEAAEAAVEANAAAAPPADDEPAADAAET
jgi:hypothetical protein